MKNIRLLALAMSSIVTYIPRVLPFLLIENVKFLVRSFLYFVPFVVLGSLIFPGILYSTGSLKSAIIGCLIAIILIYNSTQSSNRCDNFGNVFIKKMHSLSCKVLLKLCN